jgi:SAM-dependent methyltransferase
MFWQLVQWKEGRTVESHITVIDAARTDGLGTLEIIEPGDTWGITPASRIALRGIATSQEHLCGLGLDWGCGTGCLALLAARIPQVTRVFALDVSLRSVHITRQNALRNDLLTKVLAMHANSFDPFNRPDREQLEAVHGQVSFVLANPPSTDDDDGFGYRRLVLAGARRVLHPGGKVLLCISAQYGRARIAALEEDVPGFRHQGVLASTDPVVFDLTRPELLQCLRDYAQEEQRGGHRYEFITPDGHSTESAVTALARYEAHGHQPLSRWQMHLFTWQP